MSYGPDLLERTRMALADCGIDPMLVWEWDAPEGPAVGFRSMDSDDPLLRMVWRAVGLAKMSVGAKPMCWACSVAARTLSAARGVEMLDHCLAHLPLTEDCGVER